MAGQGRPLLAETKNKILRLELRGMTRTDIALACGVSKATVTRILGTKRPHNFKKKAGRFGETGGNQAA